MISVSTFGSAKMISSEGLRSAVNYVSRRDAIPFIADPIGHIKGLFSKKMNIKYLESNGPYFFDHAFGGDTYREVIARLGVKFIEKYGVSK